MTVLLDKVLQEQIASVSTLFKRHENVPASLADAALIRLAEINDLVSSRQHWSYAGRTLT